MKKNIDQHKNVVNKLKKELEEQLKIQQNLHKDYGEVIKELTKEELLKIERNIGKILRIGVFVSTTVIIIGILMFLLSGHSGYAEGVWPDKFNEILSGLVEFKALAWLMTGLFLLILTPVLRVVASIVAFAKEGDKLYVAITTLVLIILIVAMFVGHGGA